mmetsp:Transcript_72718/g.201644  ORF Transcript_72718/g.201644 Transcript_72718/m.201644 type:complete len:766 (+) Transcript_72718:141-2438(+)|eukprot:CAMPEP_0117580716 /NCGR_PEP_ID=MMETSP0784-20121206/65381_1 /TAXON_ID=39447 /ORGANISM="" /LENGTH=765 /DNA_ID=CAMNT_0005380857 /DNA_START=84 /DNA_END=2381 /DNA_ORIENTATION=-
MSFRVLRGFGLLVHRTVDSSLPGQSKAALLGALGEAIAIGQSQSTHPELSPERNASECAALRRARVHRAEQAGTAGQRLVSVCIPVYQGSSVIKRTVSAVVNQSYPRLGFLISLDWSEDTNVSEVAIHRAFATDPNQAQHRHLRIFRQAERRGWIDNVNFLLSQASGYYIAILPHDDWIPPEYYHKLAGCLDDDQDAVNCYPYIEWYEAKRQQHQQSIVAASPQQRVHEAVKQRRAVSFRGLVRRPAHGSMQPFFIMRAHKDFYLMDVVQIMQHAIAGKLKEVDVRYIKYTRADSVLRQQLDSGDVSQRRLGVSAAQYIWGHAYSKSSYSFFQRLHKSQQAQTLLQELRKTKRIAVLGAGIQGCTMALMFRRHGYHVTLYDKAHDIFTRTSSQGEGKIHLGLVYNKDESLATANHMMRSALVFAPYVEYLLGRQIDWQALKSSPFMYLIPYSSMISPSDFEAYASMLRGIYKKLIKEHPQLSYLGQRPDTLIQRTKLPRESNATFFESAYESAEFAVSPPKFKKLMMDALVAAGVQLVLNRTVSGVSRERPGHDLLGKFRVVSSGGEHSYDFVANCLWEGRKSIDDQLHVDFTSGANYRFKFGVKFEYMEKLSAFPSVTIVNGPFGDFVRYSQNEDMYFSYYPESLCGMTMNETAMRKWEDLASQNIPEDLERSQIKAHQRGFNSWFPGAFATPFACPYLGGGYILGNGRTGILDPKSLLHQRADYPLAIDDGYYSISTQKFTFAPYNTYLLERELFETTWGAKL